ncbi:MAG: Spo0B domain-containing protein [Clostridia bacterium]|nr:Spo0B domain-containing protein [Clostridia bacterium]
MKTDRRRQPLQSMEDVVRNLRIQRHGFINHMQVIYGLLQLDKIDRAMEYIRSVGYDMAYGGSRPEIGQYPELSALLCMKFAIAEARGISTACEIEYGLDSFRVRPTYLTTIIGNLLDNAIQVLSESSLPMERRRITFAIRQLAGKCVFEVWDSLGAVHPGVAPRLFEFGATALGIDEHGYGLFIAKELTEGLGGEISVSSSADRGTLFQVAFPLQADACEHKERSANVR